ncbi:glycogen/starch synthase [Candidatus Woesearchaeota archaeon]|nr:glycogen/starch synthase [Candidatus Woesearchaeota archaeon]
MVSPRAAHVFEISWEVCNKVGGIYTVVSSKAGQMIARYGKENYTLIGPHFPKKSWGVFEERIPPECWKEAIEELKNEGIICTYGTWLVKGSPNVILIDFFGFAKNKDLVKRLYWDWFGIDSIGTDYFDVDEPLIWSFCAGKLLEKLGRCTDGKPSVAHCHEWLAGGALLFATKNRPPGMGTVFTTHATVLGRTLSSSGIDLFGTLKNLNPEAEARRLGPGLWTKYQIERACAKEANTFTTVSEITGIEAQYLLGRKPDILLLNGLDLDKFPTFEEASLRHGHYKARLKEFCLAYFFPYTPFDLDETLFYFLAGRYEFRDKGVDVYIRALGKLNEQLRAEKSNRTIVAFIFIPGNIRGIKPAILENKTHFEDLKETIEDNKEAIRTRILYGLIQGRELDKDFIFDEEALEDLRRKTLVLHRQGAPPLSTHDFLDEESDIILRTLRDNGLDNRDENRVKVVFYPIYLSGADNLLNTTYYESMHGCHLGVFPSLYEPWGYTPLEASALGVSSITTDLAGFGRYVLKQGVAKEAPGIFVIHRYGVSDEDVIVELTEAMHYFATTSKQERVENKIRARELAETADWKHFADYYIEAHNMAISKR